MSAPTRHLRIRLWPLAACASLAGGCSHLPSGLLGDAKRALEAAGEAPRAPVRLPPAQRPVYRVGDTFVFGRDSVRSVSAISTEAITWRIGSPDQAIQTYRSEPDLFAPLLATPVSAGQTVSRITNRQGSLWPLEAGRRASFEEWRRSAVRGADEQRLHWQCEVGKPHIRSVPAGDFATLPVSCLAAPDGMPLVTQRFTWDYAPSLGHYVHRTWTDDGRVHEARLSAALPAELATPERIARVLQRLRSTP